jgi:glutamine cyclotransferase
VSRRLATAAVKNANPVSWRAALLLMALLSLAACRKTGVSAAAPSIPQSVAENVAGSSAITRYGYEVVRTWPHDRGAYTQGLVFRDGRLLESTGLKGRSSLREVDLLTGRIVKQVTVPKEYFAEGLAVIGSKAFQVTWQENKGFIYDADTFQSQGEFTYAGEGWGLATDGRALILSDGTSKIRFLDPTSFAVTRTLEVTADGKPRDQLNELEYIRGEIFANVFQTDHVVRIDPATGRVRGLIDFTGLLPAHERAPDTDVLNGIAYDAAGDRLFITGKLWPKIFEVRLKPITANAR